MGGLCVVVVGEIEDEEVVPIAQTSGLTGHITSHPFQLSQETPFSQVHSVA